MNVCVIGGAGYVGPVTGVGLAELGHHVVNVDVRNLLDPAAIRAIGMMYTGVGLP